MKASKKFTTLFCLALAASTVCAQAQDYPSRPIRMIVPLSPGGLGTTAAKRTAAMQKSWPISASNRNTQEYRVLAPISGRHRLGELLVKFVNPTLGEPVQLV